MSRAFQHLNGYVERSWLAHRLRRGAAGRSPNRRHRAGAYCWCCLRRSSTRRAVRFSPIRALEQRQERLGPLVPAVRPEQPERPDQWAMSGARELAGAEPGGWPEAPVLPVAERLVQVVSVLQALRLRSGPQLQGKKTPACLAEANRSCRLLQPRGCLERHPAGARCD